MKIYGGLISILLLLLMAGCGSGGGTDVPVAVASQKCVDCHASNSNSKRISSVTGASITDDWLNSSHNTLNAAGCIDCHGTGHNHPSTCSQCHGGGGATTARFSNPDAEGTCFSCHNTRLPSNHFYNVTSAGIHPAMFVTPSYRSSCISCHDPHKGDKGVSQEHRDWAESEHGDVNAPAWSYRDFKENAGYMRCHTSTGFLGYIQSGYVLPTDSLAVPGDHSREVLTCKTCHTSYSFKNSVRRPPQYAAPYNGGAIRKQFPDVGASNLCLPCHAGRENEDSIKAIADFTNASFKNSHYKAAAGLMYMTTGFTAFTSADAPIGTSTYGRSLSPDPSVPGGVTGGVRSTHRRFGTPDITGDSHNTAVFTPGNFDADGPCVTCHLNAKGRPNRGRSHTLKITPEAFSQVCINCHSDEGGVPLTPENYKEHFLEPQHEVFEEALKLAQSLLAKYNISYDAQSHPYFYDDTLPLLDGKKQSVKDWTRGTGNQKLGMKLMGACFNINLLHHEPAAYVHARTYTRRLIYDTIDFLDDGIMNLSTGATALGSGRLDANGQPVYGKGNQAYTDGNHITLYAPTTEAMIYLIGWSRSTGEWNEIERP